MNQLDVKAVVDLSSEAANENLEDVRERVVILVPHVGGDRRAVDDLPGMTDEESSKANSFAVSSISRPPRRTR